MLAGGVEKDAGAGRSVAEIPSIAWQLRRESRMQGAVRGGIFQMTRVNY